MENAVEISSRPAGGGPAHPESKPVLPLAVDAAQAQPSKARKRYLILGGVTLAVLLGVGAWSLLTAGRESTDDAMIEADIVPVATRVAERLAATGLEVEHLDGDEFRKTFSRGLGFTPDDRAENIVRAARVAALLARHRVIVLATA